jgi:hypothetical protein
MQVLRLRLAQLRQTSLRMTPENEMPGSFPHLKIEMWGSGQAYAGDGQSSRFD